MNNGSEAFYLHGKSNQRILFYPDIHTGNVGSLSSLPVDSTGRRKHQSRRRNTVIPIAVKGIQEIDMRIHIVFLLGICSSGINSICYRRIPYVMLNMSIDKQDIRQHSIPPYNRIPSDRRMEKRISLYPIGIPIPNSMAHAVQCRIGIRL